MLHTISPALVDLKERIIATIRTTRTIAQTSTETPEDDIPARRIFVSGDRHRKVTAEVLAKCFYIGTERAKATMQETTQRGVRSALLPISQRYKADRMYNWRRLMSKFATDTLWSTKRSLTGNIASQVYSHKCGFNSTYHMRNAKGNTIGYTLSEFCDKYGIPDHLTFDGAMYHTGPDTLFMKNIRRCEIKLHVSSPQEQVCHWQIMVN